MTEKPSRSPFAALTLAVLFVSTGAILVRYAQAPPLAVAFQRVFLASLLLAPFAGRALVAWWPRLTPRESLALVGSGIALALHFATWIGSLSYTSVAVSVLLVNTAPAFTVLLSRVFLHERVPPRVLAAIGVALLGAGLTARGSWQDAPGSLVGVGLSLVGAVTVAAYQVIGRGLRARLPLHAYVLGVWATSALVLAAFAVASGTPLFAHPPRSYAAFVGLAILPTLGGHGLVNLSLRALPAPTVGLFLLGEPVGASMLAFFLFGEAPGALTLAGGAVVLAALAAVVVTARR
jgi:drug/metabolite transporter (DMT)-like permease